MEALLQEVPMMGSEQAVVVAHSLARADTASEKNQLPLRTD